MSGAPEGVGLFTNHNQIPVFHDNILTPPKEGGMGHPDRRPSLCEKSLRRAGFGFGGFFFAVLGGGGGLE